MNNIKFVFKINILQVEKSLNKMLQNCKGGNFENKQAKFPVLHDCLLLSSQNPGPTVESPDTRHPSARRFAVVGVVDSVSEVSDVMVKVTRAVALDAASWGIRRATAPNVRVQEVEGSELAETGASHAGSRGICHVTARLAEGA